MIGQTVLKYRLRIADTQIVELPVGARIVKVAVQHGDICLWAWCDYYEGIETEFRRIAVVGTGHLAPSFNDTYLDTVLMNDGALVWHVFEQERQPPVAAPSGRPS